MNPDRVPILETLRARRHTRDGKIVLWGSLAQPIGAVVMLWKAWNLFPHQGTDDLLMAGLAHLVIPVCLAATFIKYGAQLDFRESSALTLFLVLIACFPFTLSVPLM